MLNNQMLLESMELPTLLSMACGNILDTSYENNDLLTYGGKMGKLIITFIILC